MDRLKRRVLNRHRARCGKHLKPGEKPPKGWLDWTFSRRRIYRIAYPKQRAVMGRKTRRRLMGLYMRSRQARSMGEEIILF